MLDSKGNLYYYKEENLRKKEYLDIEKSTSLISLLIPLTTPLTISIILFLALSHIS